MALVLSVGLVLPGTAPVLAAGQALKAAPVLEPNEDVQVVEPEGMNLSEVYLAETDGSQAPATAVRLFKTAVRAGRAIKALAKRHPLATGVVVGHYASKYVLDPVDRFVSNTWRRTKEIAGKAYGYAKKAAKRATIKLVKHALQDPILLPATW
ncbi:hypothetical protein [Oceanithermus sp.]